MTEQERLQLQAIKAELLTLATRIEELLRPPFFVECTRCKSYKHGHGALFCGTCGTKLPGAVEA